jgi:hypothetical protein
MPDNVLPGVDTQELTMPDWLTLAETVDEIQKLHGASEYEAKMQMFGELFTGARKAKGIREEIEREIEGKWFIGQIGEQGVDWSRSAMSKYGVEYTQIKVSPAEPSADTDKESRPPKFNWDQFWLEIVRMANTADGLPEDRAELLRHMTDFCVTGFSDPPGAAVIRDKLAMLPK